MKNVAIRPQASGATEPWRAAMRSFDRELQRRGAADRTRRAYGVDVGQLALWCSASGIEPDAVDYPVLRRYAAQLAGRGAGPRTVARKLAAIRSFYKSLVELGEMRANPADLLPSPKQPQRLPRTLKAEDVAALLNRIPATTPLELRDRALFELAYGCGLRAEELVDLDLESIDFDAETVRVEGKGARRDSFPPASRRCGPSRATSNARGRPLAAGRRSSPRCCSPSPAGASRRPTSDAVCASGHATPRTRAPSIRTPCGTPSRPTFSRAVQICGPSRSCLAIHPYRRPRSTLG